MALSFEWDLEKAQANLVKHEVTFDEAATVFDDPLARTYDDESHSIEEARELILGHSNLKRLVFVSFTERGRDRIRIISARLPTKGERRSYEESQDS
jgi:uncharacterized DUF497 family protein